MPRPAPVTSARRPSRRSEGVRGRVTTAPVCYRALNSGSRRSAIALTPSRKSSVSRSQSCSSYSRSVAEATASASPRRKRLPRRHDGQRRRLGDLGRQLRSPRPHLVQRHAVIRQADRQRLLAGQPPPGVHQQRRLLGADQPRQRGGQPEPRVEAQAGEVHREPRLGTGDAEVRHHREPNPGTNGGTVHRGDDRLAGPPEPLRFLI